MIDPAFLKCLRCPLTGEPLYPAAESLVERLNRAIATQQVVTRIGTRWDRHVPAALVNESRTWLYPIIDDAPWLLPREAIPFDHRWQPPATETA